MIKYSINDLEKITDIKAHTIRIWEKRYNVVTPKRTSTNIRYYLEGDVKKLLNISTLKRYGLKISDIMKMSYGEINEKVIELSSIIGDYDGQINNLFISMIEFNEDGFKKIMADSILKIGFEKTVMHILYPFLEKMGILWQVGSIIPAQEHFISNLIRQKLLVAIDAQSKSSNNNYEKTFLLFLPEDEFHELGILFNKYLLKKHGHKVIYLGQSTPFKDLIQTQKIINADYLLTHLVTAVVPYKACEYIENISKTFPDKTILVTGKQACDVKSDTPKNILIIRNSNEFKKFLNHTIKI